MEHVAIIVTCDCQNCWKVQVVTLLMREHLSHDKFVVTVTVTVSLWTMLLAVTVTCCFSFLVRFSVSQSNV